MPRRLGTNAFSVSRGDALATAKTAQGTPLLIESDPSESEFAELLDPMMNMQAFQVCYTSPSTIRDYTFFFQRERDALRFAMTVDAAVVAPCELDDQDIIHAIKDEESFKAWEARYYDPKLRPGC
jgi:hypothetical protein